MPLVGELLPFDFADLGAGVSKTALRLLVLLAGVFGVTPVSLSQSVGFQLIKHSTHIPKTSSVFVAARGVACTCLFSDPRT